MGECLGFGENERIWFTEGRRKLGINYMECTPAYDSLPSGKPQSWKTIAFLLLPLQGSLSLSYVCGSNYLLCLCICLPFALLGFVICSLLPIVTLKNRLLQMFIISLS
jgi:hypothetical protein